MLEKSARAMTRDVQAVQEPLPGFDDRAEVLDGELATLDAQIEKNRAELERNNAALELKLAELRKRADLAGRF
jgi:hypothetical protein